MRKLFLGLALVSVLALAGCKPVEQTPAVETPATPAVETTTTPATETPATPAVEVPATTPAK